MRTKVTLFLIFLNVALFFFIFKIDGKWDTDGRARDARTRVLGPEAADIRKLEISSTAPGATPVALMRRGDTWWLTKPFEWPANPYAASAIVNELKLLEHVSSFSTKDLPANSMSLADYGLAPPKLTVTFASGDAPPTLLRIGDSTNIGNRLYVLSPDGQRIHVVAHGLADTLSLGLDKLRADDVLTVQTYEAVGLIVQIGNSPRLRIRSEANGWFYDTILNNARASKTAVDLTIGELNKLKVRSFAPAAAPATLPSADPKLRVTIEGNRRRETLLLGDPVPSAKIPGKTDETEYYAQLEGRAALFTVVVPNALVEVLRNALFTLREKRLLDFDPRAVTAVALTAPNQPPLTLLRIDAGTTAAEATWQIVRRGDTASGPQTQPADRAVVQRLLEQLTLLSAKDAGGFVSEAPPNADLEKWGFNRPEREIALTLSAAPKLGAAPAAATPSTTTTLQLGTDGTGAVFARLDPLLNPKGSVYAIDLDYRREFPVAPRDWRERQLPALPPTATITALTLFSTAPDATPIYTRKIVPPETWVSVLAAEPAPRKEALEKLLAQIRAPRAKRFIQDSFTDRVTIAGDDRPWSYKLEATVALPGGTGAEQTSTKTLLFTERVGGAQQVAGSREFDAVFEVEQPVLDALWTFTYGPRDPGAASSEVPKR